MTYNSSLRPDYWLIQFNGNSQEINAIMPVLNMAPVMLIEEIKTIFKHEFNIYDEGLAIWQITNLVGDERRIFLESNVRVIYRNENHPPTQNKLIEGKLHKYNEPVGC